MAIGRFVGIIASVMVDDGLQYGCRAEGHFAGVAGGANVVAAGAGEAISKGSVAENLVKALGEVFGVFGAMEQAALGFC